MIVKNVEKQEHNNANFQVEADSAAFEAAVNKAYLKNKGSIYIPGFRKGKAPRAVIEGMYGADTFYEDAIDALGQEAFAYGLAETKFAFVGTPAISNVDIAEDKTVTYTFSLTLYPEAVLGQYKELELEKEVPVIDDAAVNERIEADRKKNARMVPVEREAQMGDTVNIDFDGYLDGVQFDGGKAEGYNLELGSNSFVPGFEEQVAGMKAGEERDLDITFPENYAEELAGKAVVFKVRVNSVVTPEYPELDDEFAKDVSEFDTFEEYRADVVKNLTEAKTNECENAYRANLLKLASDNVTVEIPAVMVEDKMNEIIRNYAANFGINSGDIPAEKLAEMLGINEDIMTASIRPSAEYQVKVELMLEAIIKAENIEISEEEGDEYIAKIAGDYGAAPEDIVSYFGREFIISEYKKEKASGIIMDTAKNVKGKKMPTEAAPIEEAAETEEKPAAKKRTKKAEEAAEPTEEKPTPKKRTKKAETAAEPSEEKPAPKKRTKKADAE